MTVFEAFGYFMAGFTICCSLVLFIWCWMNRGR